MRDAIQRLLRSRELVKELRPPSLKKCEGEGGCGVVGFCCTEPVPGRHIYEPSRQMHNRGNGKGGGVAAVGLIPEQLGVSREVLDSYYMLQIAFLDPSVMPELEKNYIIPNFNIAASGKLETVDDWRTVDGLEVKPPDVKRYFVRARPEVLDSFIEENGLKEIDRREVEDEFVNQNSFRLNREYYASLGEKRAFVLSHGRNIMILKVVGYAEAIVQYYKIEDLCAHVWIAHQRFPTKGRVWHPAGAHPFAGINMALVHNGDFANYHSVSEYLLQRNIYPLFLTDTEVSALLFDLLNRTYHYPLEYIIEAMAPTAELDFDKLPEDKRDIYRAIQATHIHGSPDGPWFFIIARNDPVKKHLQLLGITDTAMLRPQVFAFSEGEVQVGLICSEKQAIDATLLSLSREDKRICPVADRYWNARGGSHTDGGAFIFNLEKDSRGRTRMTCTDKFGVPVSMPGGKACDFSTEIDPSATVHRDIEGNIKRCFEEIDAAKLFEYLRGNIPLWSFDDFRTACRMVTEHARDSKGVAMAIRVLTMLNDFRYPRGLKKRSHILHIVRGELNRLFENLPRLDAGDVSGVAYRLIDYDSRDTLREPRHEETTLVIDARRFPPDGNDCDAALLVNAFIRGWRHFICFNGIGQRFIGCGLGPETDGVTIDVYGSSGDYLGSGIDGLTITVHNNAQDQLGQIIKRGKLVVYGDVGQTFMYGAKGGEVYVLGNAAGRPLINSVGRPRVVINGTCLDFLGESFMAGDPHERGGFIILNSVTFDHDDRLIELEEPYPGSNLFSLASGGAIYVRDPHEKVVEQQLNGGVLDFLEERDWELMVPYLAENERLFGIMIDDLLTVNGQRREPIDVYRKVTPSVTRVLASESYDSRVEEKTVKEAVMDKEVQ